MNIKNDFDLKTAYRLLLFCKQSGDANIEMVVKGDIRRYNARSNIQKERIIKCYGIDGCTSLIELPGFLKTEEDARDFFEEKHAVHFYAQAFDHTGQAFTAWYKIFKRQDRFYAYHNVRFDI